jgi:glycogen operon protein
MLNAYWEALEFELPPLGPYEHWGRIVDTVQQAPADIAPISTDAPKVTTKRYRVAARSAVVLMAI